MKTRALLGGSGLFSFARESLPRSQFWLNGRCTNRDTGVGVYPAVLRIAAAAIPPSAARITGLCSSSPTPPPCPRT